ncbi:MAG: inositol monophosphatase family protein [Anaerolineales bacterium]
MSIFLETALEAAAGAGAVLRDKFPQTREIKSKGWRDIVTDADFAAQQAALEILTARFPDHGILTEEGRHDVSLTASERPIWVMDPLDGTTNYARQFPAFSVALALVHQGEIQVGVIHDPLRRETFFAEKGQGAFRQGEPGPPQPLRVSRLTDFGDALIGVDWARDPAARQQVLEALVRVAPQCRTLRSVGSAALNLAYLAAGWLDGYFHLSLQPWDVAAGALLVTEAGGMISAPDGGAWQLGNRRAVVSNGLLHEVLLRTLELE